MNNDIIQQFFEQLKVQLSNNQPLGKVLLINVETNQQLIAGLQNYLLDNPGIDIGERVDSFKFFSPQRSKNAGNDNEKAAFNQYIQSFLTFCRGFNPYSVIESMDLLLNYLNLLIVVFNNYDDLTSVLIGVLTQDLHYIYKLGLVTDRVLFAQRINKSYPIVSKISINLSKLFNNCKKNLTKNKLKQSILLRISNYLVQIYFKIGQPLNCNTIFISNRHNFRTLKGSSFTKSDLIKYRFFLGRFLLITNNYSQALTQFKYCYLKHSVSQLRNSTNRSFERILELLVITLLINGYRPRLGLLSKFAIICKNQQLATIYSQLVQHIHAGNIGGFTELIESNRDYFRFKSFYNLLLKNLLPIVHRNLFFRVFKIYNNGNLTANNYKHVISYNEFLVGLRLAGGIGTTNNANTRQEEMEKVEEILVSLINKNWIKGIIFPNSNKLSVSKKGDCFSPIVRGQDLRLEYDWLDK